MPVIPKNCTQQDVVYNGQYGVVTDSNGLYYMRARYYNVDIKRFINQDVVEGSIINSPSLNKYAYCQGNPVSLLDPFGLSPQSAGSFAGHLILDILGFIPVIGFFADVINGAWYLAEGNYFCAAMSFIAAIPMFGDAVGLTAEGTKYACVFNKIVFGTRALANLATFGRSLSQISEISADLTQKHIVEGKKWDSESTLEVITGLGYIAEAIFSAYDFGNSVNGFANSQCFVAGTLVLTSEGSKPIEEIQAGDLVYSTDPETGESEYKEVVRAFRKESDVIIHVFVNGEEIETTPNHPFWVEDQWVNAKDLREGDVLTLADGTTATITRTYGEQLDEPVIVYNFEVCDFHTYYVTDIGVLVHNANKYAQDDSESRTDWGPEHGRGNAKHNNAIEDELNVASQNGATDIRKNRVQVDADGNRVYYSGHRYTRPDASYIIGGTRYNTNYVSNYMLDNPAEISREWEAFINMQNADPNAVNMLVLIY